MDRTECAIRKLLAALPEHGYDLGMLGASGMQRLEALTADRVLRMLPYLKHRNANGAHIYIRPTGESAFTLLDDLTASTLARMHQEDFAPAAVVETSPGNFQAWLRHTEPYPKELGTLAARMLALRFGADLSAADWRRFGRAPGFTNRKSKYKEQSGLFPFARLISFTGQVFAAAETFRAEVIEQCRELQRRSVLLRAQRGWLNRAYGGASVSLQRFRNDPRYLHRPAAADMAFSICACSQGWHPDQIAEVLRLDYLSRDPSPTRRNAYIQRTLSKAQRWAA